VITRYTIWGGCGLNKSLLKNVNILQILVLQPRARLWSLISSISSRRPGFDPKPVNVGFVIDKVAVGQVSHKLLRFHFVSIIPPMFYARLFIHHRLCVLTAVDSVMK